MQTLIACNAFCVIIVDYSLGMCKLKFMQYLHFCLINILKYSGFYQVPLVLHNLLVTAITRRDEEKAVILILSVMTHMS